MTDPKALEHACQCAGRSVHHFDRMALDLPLRASIIAHARAIEQHEAFRREVSDAVEYFMDGPVGLGTARERLGRFIIAKPDEATAGLALAVEETLELVIGDEDARRLRAAIEARGGRIVWEGDND